MDQDEILKLAGFIHEQAQRVMLAEEEAARATAAAIAARAELLRMDQQLLQAARA